MTLLAEKKLLGYPESVIPDDYETTRVQVFGEKKKQKVVYNADVIFPPKKEWRASCSQYDVGIPASIAAQMIAKGDISVKGAVPPEVCVDPEPFIAELAKRNIKVYETSKKLLK
jgi:saccharopine dehydrogenase-like NADP-dependent oxidoreductase